MSNLITTKQLHKIVAQTFKKYNVPKPRSKTRRVHGVYNIPSSFRGISNIRRVEFVIPDNFDLKQILSEIKVMLTLYGYDHIIREHRNPYTRKTRLDLYAKME